ncbi:hypothetical protein N9991_00055 [bacterium]|nr:hypothetical protein [bacterium]|tara:strand:- start:177 stop:350 length:174 start_codon:yes stop_codon:yes gene_type:complete
MVEVDVKVVKELNQLTEAPLVAVVVDPATQIIQAQNLQVVVEQVEKVVILVEMVVLV